MDNGDKEVLAYARFTQRIHKFYPLDVIVGREKGEAEIEREDWGNGESYPRY